MSGSTQPSARRVIMLGLDALVPNTLERFMEEGIVPTMKRMAEAGAFSRARPVIPAQTPTNWTTIATGATPGTHGIVQWGSHLPGEPVWEYHRPDAFSSGLCRAEYVWEAAARSGVRSVVMNYAGYPPTSDEVTHIEWLYQPMRSYFDLAPPTVYHNCPDLNTTDPIEPVPAEGWVGVFSSDRPPLEVELPVVPSSEGEGPTFHGLIIAKETDYDTLVLCREKDTSTIIAEIAIGEWTGWVRRTFHTAEHGNLEGAFRFKLVELSANAHRVRIYRSDAFATDGNFCSEPELARKLIAELGPYVHSGMTCQLQAHGTLDMETADQVMADEAAWWSGAAALAMEERDARLLVLHWHNIDMMGHTFVPRIDPTGSVYDPEKADEAWEVVRAYYRAADRFVARFVERFDDGETAFVIISDHGMPANAKAVALVNAFLEKGWVTKTPDGKDVDWAKSKVFFAQNHLWINLRGRDEGGIVPQEEYDSLRRQVIAAMRDIKDPETGDHCFPFVLSREDAPMVGLWGDYIGDVVYCYAGGYRWTGPEVLAMNESRVVFPSGGGNHGPMIPTYETEVTSVMGALVLWGKGIREGVRFPASVQAGVTTADVTPTMAHLLGTDAPAQCEGRVLREFLAAEHAEWPERTVRDMERPLQHRPGVRPRKRGLRGDVTDEA